MKYASVSVCRNLILTVLLAALTLIPSSQVFAGKGGAKTFAMPEAAAAALFAAAKSRKMSSTLAILGSGAKDLIASGDPVQDEKVRTQFVAAYEEKHAIITIAGKTAILEIGNDGYPFPFPIVKTAAGWAFDLEQAREEVLNRRIGKNELNTIEVMLAITSAQHEYARVDWDGDGLRVYASKFKSSAGKRDGLYWAHKEGQPASPLGPLVAQAASQGYKASSKNRSETSAYHGYHFKLITRQGASAPGGAHSYIVNGKMLGGFAAVAYPAKYEASGIMTFMVNHDGTVYEADLGPKTANAARAISEFNLGGDWKKVVAE